MIVPREAELAVVAAQARLKDNLLSVYLYGSAVAGGLRPNSDVDVMMIVKAPLTPGERLALLADAMASSGRYPIADDGRRPIEMIVFAHDRLKRFTHPVQSEFVYGEWLRAGFEAGDIPRPSTQPDFTLLLAQARQNGVSLVGPEPAEMLPDISRAAIRLALRETLPDLVGSLAGDERNVVLTLARMWRTAALGDFVAKDVAAAWASARLPDDPAGVVAHARDAYFLNTGTDWEVPPDRTLRAVEDIAERVSDLLQSET